MNWYHDFIGLLYPSICITCGNNLFRNEKIICTRCRYKLPITNFHLLKENPVSRALWGRVPLESAAAYLYFKKSGVAQVLMHELKYRGNKEMGIFLGELYGYELNTSRLFETIDCIVPVPLHKKKLKKRGYNQSEMIAIGLSRTFGKAVIAGNLYRKVHSSTQTRKTKYERWLNVDKIFGLRSPSDFENKHILLVDDVITTGATLEACAQVLLKLPKTRISIATIAFVA